MDQESVADYLAWLDAAYQEAYANGKIELDDYYKYQEEVYEKTKEQLQTVRKELENSTKLITNWINNAVSRSDTEAINKHTEDIIDTYKKMQQEVAEEAKWYREHGFSDTSDEVSELSNLWWNYHDNIVKAVTDAYDEIDKELDNRITLTENWLERAVTNGDYDKIRQYTDDIFDYYTKKQQAIHEAAVNRCTTLLRK